MKKYIEHTNRSDGKVLIEVKIIKQVKKYGHDRYLITPIRGSGEMWVQNIIETEK